MKTTIMKLPLTEYIEAGMDGAVYDKLGEDRYYGEIPQCIGVYADGRTLRECQDNLRSVLEGWVLLGLKLRHTLPVLKDINLNGEPELEPVDSV